MESTSLSGRIQISRSTYERVYDLGYEFEERMVEVKGKGLCNTYMLKAHHHDCAVVTEGDVNPVNDDGQGHQPNSSNNILNTSTDKHSYPDSNLSKESDQLEYQYLAQNRDSQ